jgi:hypothetical protein
MKELIQIFWLLYLIAMLFITFGTITDTAIYVRAEYQDKKLAAEIWSYKFTTLSVMYAIWYMYYLH